MININQLITLVAFTTTCISTSHVYAQGANAIAHYDSVLVDKDGNKYTIRKLKDGKLWITTNLKINISNSYCYNDSTKYCDEYGRLYTWESAQVGCSSLGAGWRLPTKDEWQQLTNLYGDTTKQAQANREKAYQALLYSGNTELKAVLGGGRNLDSTYARIEAHGFYWTITETDIALAWFANFAKGSQALYLQNEGEKPRAFSVRCIKNP